MLLAGAFLSLLAAARVHLDTACDDGCEIATPTRVDGHSPHQHRHDSDHCQTCNELLLAKQIVQKFRVVLVCVGDAPLFTPATPAMPALSEAPVMSLGPPRGPPCA